MIIIVKQPGPGQASLERVSQGPVEVGSVSNQSIILFPVQAARMFSEQGISRDRVMGFTYLDDNVPSDFKAVLDSLGNFILLFLCLVSFFPLCPIMSHFYYKKGKGFKAGCF